MTNLEIIFLVLFISSIFINLILFIHYKKLKLIFSDLFIEIKKLQNLLSNSTSNLNQLLKDNKSLQEQVNFLKKTKSSLLAVNMGDKVICKQSLKSKKTNHSFDVLYECNVIEATEKNLKLNAIDFKSDDDWAIKEKSSVIAYFQERWVDRSDCELIIDQQHLRDSKINDLLY